jgi:acetylornithine deacetylase/succinyl-diaminopimelate desuccinylase-like protein
MDTIQITVLEAGQQVNAIPATARALIDVRALPDTDLDSLLGEIRSTLGNDLSVSVVLDAPRVSPSPADGPVFECIDRVLSPKAPVVPSFMAGVTDSRHFRQRGIPAYGFSPFAIGLGDAQGVHGVDERLATGVFEAGVRTMTEVVARCVSE